ncbi:hypothetical protein [Bremerella sp.]|uniref:hypothetical protein n=1 Tax=Bremerella sp. TaxID=2795602 RepID=UPI003919E3C5
MSSEAKVDKTNGNYYRIIGWLVLIAIAVYSWMIYKHQVQLNRSIEESIKGIQAEHLAADREADAMVDEIVALMETGVPVDPNVTPLLLDSPLREKAISVLLQQIGDPRFVVAFYAMQNLKTLVRKIDDPEQFADQVIPGVLPMLKHPDMRDDVIDVLESVEADLKDVRPQLLDTMRPGDGSSVSRAIRWARQLNPSCDVIPFYVEYMKQMEKPNRDLVWWTVSIMYVEPEQLAIAMEKELSEASTPAEKATIQAWIEVIREVADEPLFRPTTSGARAG